VSGAVGPVVLGGAGVDEAKGRLFSPKELALAGAVVLCLYVGSHFVLSRYSAARTLREYGIGPSLYVPLSLETVDFAFPLFWLHHGLRIIYAPLWLVDHHVFGGPLPLRSMPMWSIEYEALDRGNVSLASCLFVACCFTMSLLFGAVVLLARRSAGRLEGARGPRGGDAVLILAGSYGFAAIGALLAGLWRGDPSELAIYMAFSQIIAAAVLYHWGLVILLRRLLRGEDGRRCRRALVVASPPALAGTVVVAALLVVAAASLL